MAPAIELMKRVEETILEMVDRLNAATDRYVETIESGTLKLLKAFDNLAAAIGRSIAILAALLLSVPSRIPSLPSPTNSPGLPPVGPIPFLGLPRYEPIPLRTDSFQPTSFMPRDISVHFDPRFSARDQDLMRYGIEEFARWLKTQGRSM